MHIADDLIEQIVGSCQVPSGKKRLEIERELRAHVEDFVLVAREAGHSDQDIRRLLIANFGNPREIAEDFATVYRRERAIQRLSIFLLGTLTAASLISAVVLGLQAATAISLGIPVSRVFGGQHVKLETLYILCTVAAYVGVLCLEKAFDQFRMRKAMATAASICSVLCLIFSRVGVPPEMIAAAFVSGALLRTIQIILKGRLARLSAATAFFGLIGAVSACRQWPAIEPESVVRLVTWLAIGVCGYLMTSLSKRLDRALPTSL